ncbi:MAG: SRPBCC family protein [Hyphomonadaceae bacterium]|nr:SRPBCC family protein [Hyphomonadaceae bacterium]
MAHELSIELILDAPAEKLFRCHSEAALLQQWFAPKPWTITSTDIDFRPGGKMAFVMASPEGQAFPNAGIYLEIVPNKRIVSTDAVTPDFQPSGPFMIAEVTFEDLGNGKTRYRAVARHWNEETMKQHEQMGFAPGWTQTAKQMEALAQTL